MTGKIAKGDESKVPIMLRVLKVEAKEKIKKQIDEGEKLLDLEITSEQDLEDLKRKKTIWNDYNAELLLVLFDNDRMSKEYSAFYPISFRTGLTNQERIGYDHKYINNFLTRLKSIERRLEFFSDPKEVEKGPITSYKKKTSKTGKDIFIVHGTDDSAKQTVARYIGKLNLHAVILHEKPNKGRTIIEKFEAYSNVVGFAVVLLTPDDIGALKSTSDNSNPRARQNVILELGYFLGKLGRNRVCALYSKDVELPSDILGIIYIPFDENDAWRLPLAREIKAAGIDVDLNSII